MRALALTAACLAAACSPAPTKLKPLPFVAATFNTGTSPGQPWTPDSGYADDQAAISDQYYGNGLSWLPAVENVKRFLADTQPDVIAFEEIFDPPDCANIPTDGGTGFYCETWHPGDPTVAQHVLGAGYQVACNLGKPDKCLGVKKSFGTLHGCASDLCYDGLAGHKVDTCGFGSRVGRGVIDLPDGRKLTVVLVHASPGLASSDQDCRVKQVEQVFVDLGVGDGPAANDSPALILGDFNTDPGRLIPNDVSAVRWRDFAGPGKEFHFVTPMGPDVTPTYGGILNIDHLVSDVLSGPCWIAGVTEGHPDVNGFVLFDHKPHVCNLELPVPKTL